MKPLGRSLFLTAALLGSLIPVGAAATMRLDADAREISRKLIHVREELPVKSGRLALWYPKWIPGTHAPGGPIANLGGLSIESADGHAIDWRRDETEVYRFEFTVPEGVDRISIHLDYICNPPSATSEGVDSFGDAELGIINWNTCLLYPGNVSIDDLLVSASLKLPNGWRFGTALKTAEKVADKVTFAPETLRYFVDSPVIFGENLRTIELKPETLPPVYMHLVSESPQAIQLDDEVIDKYRQVANQAGALFGGAHFDEYHFLVTCSDQVGESGVEHLDSSMDGVRERDLIDDKKRHGRWVAALLPHEFSHSWCGKHRRPAGMVTTNFHTPEQTSLLWVYEGLTQYLGDLLTVRSGLVSPEKYLRTLAFYVDTLMHTEGRKWRPLEDTANASHVLRAHSPYWGELRRSQDYYFEGMLLWLEADSIIRQQSDGRSSLDDFCRRFMGPQRHEKLVPYDRAEVIETLQGLANYDWAGFLHDRVDVIQEALPLSSIERCGYRLQYATKPSEELTQQEQSRKLVTATDSVGIVASEDGVLRTVVPGMAADKAGLAPGMKVEGVNGRKFSRERLQDAIADSVTKRHVDFLVLEGDTYRTMVVPYADGPKYLELVRDPAKPDLLMQILKPLPIRARAGSTTETGGH
jgi:predicted metalloprotease with PDZ domain